MIKRVAPVFVEAFVAIVVLTVYTFYSYSYSKGVLEGDRKGEQRTALPLAGSKQSSAVMGCR